MPIYPALKDHEWCRPKKKFKLGCCDCGLVHEFIFRIRNGYIEFKAVRHNKSTAALRRERKKKLLLEIKKQK